MSLEVREVGDVKYKLVPVDPLHPIKAVDEVLSDDAARERLRELLRSGLYRSVSVAADSDTANGD